MMDKKALMDHLRKYMTHLADKIEAQRREYVASEELLQALENDDGEGDATSD
jgi:hypothetical protein